MFSNKIATMCYVDERSLLLLFLSQYSFLTCPFSKELENGWLGIFPLTSALYRPAWVGRPVWAEAVSILMLLASLLIRLFFKRTKQIIQSESKSIKQWLWFSPLLFRNNKEENHKSSEYILLVFHSQNPDTEVTGWIGCLQLETDPIKIRIFIISEVLTNLVWTSKHQWKNQ